MIEATRLVRSGRLAQATAFIQRMLGGTARDPLPGDASVDTGPKSAGSKSTGSTSVERDLKAPSLLGSLLGRATARSLEPVHSDASAPSPDLVPAREARFLSATFTNGAGTRTYKLYIPAQHQGRPLPLVVMLHGCTQSPDDFARGTRMNVLAEEQGFLVAYPAQTASANMSKCWNWFKPADQVRDSGEPSLIAGITRQIMRDHAVDPDRVYVAGLSAGGAAAAIMGSAYPDLYAAVGVHSGLACGAARDLGSAMAAMQSGGKIVAGSGAGRLVPTIVFHGDKDTTVHPKNATQVIEQRRAAEPGSLRAVTDAGSHPGGHSYSRTRHLDASDTAVLEKWEVHGAAHAWSGGHSAGSFTDPRGPDASREMLRFFRDHVGVAKK